MGLEMEEVDRRVWTLFIDVDRVCVILPFELKHKSLVDELNEALLKYVKEDKSDTAVLQSFLVADKVLKFHAVRIIQYKYDEKLGKPVAVVMFDGTITQNEVKFCTIEDPESGDRLVVLCFIGEFGKRFYNVFKPFYS